MARDSLKPRLSQTDHWQVFLALWSEPGDEHTPGSIVSEKAWTRNRFGELVYSKVYRFVVVKADTRYCQAVRITSYAGQGVAKRGVKKSDHAIVYTGRNEPATQPEEQPPSGESGMQPYAIRVDTDQRDEKLDPMSRIDFGRTYTVQHYQRVKSFGMVHRNSVGHLQSQWQNVLLYQGPPATIGHSAHRNVSSPSAQVQSTSSVPQPLENRAPVAVPAARNAMVSLTPAQRAIRDLMSAGWPYEDAKAVLRPDGSEPGVK